MAVTSVQDVWTGRTGRADGAADIRTYVRELIVQTDDPNDGPKTVLAATGVPAVGDAYSVTGESDTAALCIAVDALPNRATRTVWSVTADYSTDVGTTNFNQATNPLLRDPIVDQGVQKFRERIFRDADGKAIVNSVGDPWPTSGMERDKSLSPIRITVNRSGPFRTHAAVYQDVVNKDPFLGFSVTTVKAEGVAIRGPLVENGVTYWEHVYMFLFKRDGWREPLPDRGFRAKNPNNNNNVQELGDGRGGKTRVPLFLNGKGFLLGGTGNDPGGGGAIFLKGGGAAAEGILDGVKKYDEINFSTLGFSGLV